MERPWFFVLTGGVSSGTPYGPGERWVRGVQTCDHCYYEWIIEG